MNKKVDEEFIGIRDIYVLRCMCTEMKDEIIDLRKKNKELIKKNEFSDLLNVILFNHILVSYKDVS